jgi:hypothetical protein
MSPLYLPICGIYLPFQVNLYVPNSKPSNEILFCMLEQLMFQLGLPVSSMLGGLFSRGVDSTPHSRGRAGNRDAQSHDPKRSKQIKIIKQNSPRAVVSWRHSLFRASHGLMLVGGWGSINLYHSVWELPIMHVVWKISPSHSCCIDSESMPLKMLFISILKSSSSTSTNPCFPLRRAYLFTFMLSHHHSY